MLTESEVIVAVCEFLKSKGFEVAKFRNEVQQGIDIEGVAPDGRRISIEAKGETSSKPATAGFGRPFSRDQAFDHVAKAVYCAARDTSRELTAGVALPRNEPHIEWVEEVLPALRKMGIEVFWVLADKSVQTEGVWKYWQTKFDSKGQWASLDWSECPAVESVPGRVSGAWVFRGTRIPVSAVFENLEDGLTIDQIVEMFDGLKREQVVTVLDFAAQSLAAPILR
jgi:uncharacterized protein (DUF433 family)